MKEPVLSRRKKPTAVAVAGNGPSRKIKLVCSFNGAFQQRPPSGKLRYIGGETRIVSVDRTIGYAKLRSKISELCPTARSFSIKYLLPEARNARDDAPLVLIASDDDVRCMIEEYDKLECYGKHARLWLYVCSEDCVSVKGNRELFVNFVDTDHLGWETNGVRERNVFGDHQVEAKTGRNSGNEVLCGDDSLRKVVLKRQILAKQSAKSVHCVSNVDGNETEMESACYVENQKYDHPLIDLSPQSHVQITLRPNLEKLYGLHMLDCQVINTHVPGSDHLGNLVTVSQPHPLNPRDGNIRVEANSSSQCLSGQSGQMFCNGDGISTGCSGPSVGIVQTLKQSCNRSKSTEFHNSNGKHNLGNSEQGAISIMNRENMPWAANCVSVKNDSVPLSCVCPLAGSCYSLIPKTSDWQWGVSQSGIRNHQFGVTDTRNQRVHLFHLRSHRNNVTEVNNHRTVRLDGRPLVGKCYPGFRPNSSISKQGQSVRPHHPLKLWTDFHDLTFEGKTSVVKSSNVESREQGDLAVLQHGNPCSKECHLSYDTCAVLPEKSLLSLDSVESASPCMETMDAQADHLMGLNNVKSEVPYKTVHESFRGVQMNRKTTHNDLEKEHILMDPLKVSNFSLSNNPLHGSTTELGCDINALDAEASSTLNGKFESSVDLPLHNLSLLSSEKVEPPVVSSLAGCDVSEALLKFQSKPSDLMVEVQLSRGPVIDESNGAAYPSPHVADKLENVYLHEKEIQEDPSSVLSHDEKADTKENRNCLKETGGSGISRDLSAFYTRLVTRELQTIKNSDLEHVKELGSGTYGTVFHGKWRGSDVAIKRIKPSCFTEGGVEEDRLVADFWREAHILAQLHHPNIVAFYGVVTDGPVTNLATVTEYMVNVSLKQVLRRKDRTIDRRKRLIIAMDAAFGMEYLHEKNIVHFDLKSHNFLVNMRDPQRPVCKIGDMGLSKIKQKTLISGGVRGTIPWMAPELLNSENNLVTEKVDVYSFGIVMWELLTGEEPYRNMRSEEIIAGIIKGNLRPEVPTWCEPAWRSLMQRCWSSDPDSRPSFSEVAKELRAMSATMNIN